MSLPAAKMERRAWARAASTGKSPRQRVVEPPGECDRRLVGDLELHAYHCRYTVVDKACGSSPRRGRHANSVPLRRSSVRRVSGCARLGEAAQFLARDFVRISALVFEDQDPALVTGAIAAMADEVEDVDLAVSVDDLVELLQGPLAPTTPGLPLLRCTEGPSAAVSFAFSCSTSRVAKPLGELINPSTFNGRLRGVAWDVTEIERAGNGAVDRLGEEARLLVEELPGEVHQRRRSERHRVSRRPFRNSQQLHVPNGIRLVLLPPSKRRKGARQTGEPPPSASSGNSA